MVAPQACVAVEVTGSPAAELRAALERRCSDILGARRCRIVAPGEGGAGCWRVVVAAEGGDTPTDASVVLEDVTEPLRAPVRRDVTFRPNDLVAERWATLGLVIAALVTVEEHSAADAVPAAPWNAADGGFAPVVEARREAPPSRSPWSGAARASAVAALGALPEAAVGARIELSATRAWFALLGRATVFPGDSRAVLDAKGAAGELQLSTAGVGLCGTGSRGRWSARGCLGGDLARTSARGNGVSETNSSVVWWGAAWLGASAELQLYRHLALTAELEGALALVRPSFGIYGVSSTFTAAPVGGLFALGVAVPF